MSEKITTLLLGPIGAGKTTRARKLYHGSGEKLVVLSRDEIYLRQQRINSITRILEGDVVEPPARKTLKEIYDSIAESEHLYNDELHRLHGRKLSEKYAKQPQPGPECIL